MQYIPKYQRQIIMFNIICLVYRHKLDVPLSTTYKVHIPN